eukprot:1910831-Pleurochrysis_carterae.AAC.1
MSSAERVKAASHPDVRAVINASERRARRLTSEMGDAKKSQLARVARILDTADGVSVKYGTGMDRSSC